MIAIAEALKINTFITDLNVWSIKIIIQFSLSHFLNENKIGDEGAEAIGELLKLNTTLTDLNLADN